MDRIHIRLFRESDINAIRHLFDASFPIKYDDSFYDGMRSRFFCGNELKTYVAEYLDEDIPIIIGCISSQNRKLDGSDVTGPKIVETFLFSHVVYILNIAVSEEFKHCGIGSCLIQNCIEMNINDPVCAGVYLHVLAENTSNVRFYEHCNFKRVSRCRSIIISSVLYKDFYNINDRWKDSYMYIYPFHGSTAVYSAVSGEPDFSIIFVLSVASILCFIGCQIYKSLHS